MGDGSLLTGISFFMFYQAFGIRGSSWRFLLEKHFSCHTLYSYVCDA